MLIVDALTAKTAKHTDPEDHPEQRANHLIAHDHSDEDDQNIPRSEEGLRWTLPCHTGGCESSVEVQESGVDGWHCD
jgi:hypothetical protein